MRTAATIEAQQSDTAQENSESRRGKHPRSLANLKLWKPGQSGNPGGRAKNDTASEIARAIFNENPEVIYGAFGEALKDGNAYAFQVLADRAFGKLKESREVMHRYEDVPDDDLERRVNELVRDLGLAAQVDAVGADQGAAAGAVPAAEQT